MATALWSAARRARTTLSLTPFDTTTPEGRARERRRRAALTALASMAARGVGIAAALITVPLTVRYLGPERYGLWVTISSLLAFLSFADLGMGNGLLNAVAAAHGAGDEAAARRYVSSAFFFLLAVAAALGLAFAGAYALVPWPRLFNVRSPLAAVEAGPAVAVLVACFVANLPLGVVQRVQLGYQEGFANSAWEGMGSALSLAGLVLAVHARAGVPWLVLAAAGGPTIALLLNGYALFWRRRPALLPRPSYVSRDAGARVVRVGILFFVLQVVGATAFLSDNLIAAQIVGASAVTTYAVPKRLFDLQTVLCGLALAPLWPAYGEAAVRGDVAWIRAALRRSVGAVLLFTVLASAVLVVWGAPIVRLWAGPAVRPSFALLLGLGLWTVMLNVGTAASMFLNGVNAIRFQVGVACAMGVGAVALKVVLTRQYGVPGVVWGTLVAYGVLAIAPIAWYIPRILRGLERNRALAPAAPALSSPPV